MLRQLLKWVEVREEIFSQEKIPREMWDKLADAEHDLMKVGREIANEDPAFKEYVLNFMEGKNREQG